VHKEAAVEQRRRVDGPQRGVIFEKDHAKAAAAALQAQQEHLHPVSQLQEAGASRLQLQAWALKSLQQQAVPINNESFCPAHIIQQPQETGFELR
jgi:hypothetical protein